MTYHKHLLQTWVPFNWIYHPYFAIHRGCAAFGKACLCYTEMPDLSHSSKSNLRTFPLNIPHVIYPSWYFEPSSNVNPDKPLGCLIGRVPFKYQIMMVRVPFKYQIITIGGILP